MVTSLPAPDNLVTGPADQADVVIVCVTYNSADIILAWLHALPAALATVGSARVVITDNASTDGTPELIRRAAPWVELVTPGKNLGYSGGINAALGVHRGRRGVYVLNPDALPQPGSIAELADTADREASVGIVVPVVLAADGGLKFSLRREPTLLRAAGEALLGGHRAARFPALGEQVRDRAEYVDGAIADWATGAAMYISSEAIDAVGGWDERFFLYSEETDFALRARDAGFTLRLAAKAAVEHPGGEMETASYLWAISVVNRTRLYRKRHATGPSALYWLITLLSELVRATGGRERSRSAIRALLKAGPNQPGPQSTPTIIAPNDRRARDVRTPDSRRQA